MIAGAMMGLVTMALHPTGHDIVRDPGVQGALALAVHSLADVPRTVEIECEHPLVDLFDDDELPSEDGRVAVPLGRYGGRWFRVRRPGAMLAP